jgi:dolichol-phosphate mannosyltransferase
MKTLVRLRERTLALKPFLGKFAIVGLLGVAVNQGCLLLLMSLSGLRLQWAGAIAIELSILNNFFLNNSWTWRDRRRRPFISRFILYHLVTLLSGICNYVILLFLHHEGMHYGIANLFGMGAGTVINFFLNYYWTFAY